jgi:transcriptional regulator with PAS, ATPase and Fis domain
MGKVISKIDRKIYEIFTHYTWPGNIRELQNTIERMINYVESDKLSADLIPKEITQNQRSFDTQGELESLKDIEYKMLSNMLNKNLSKKEIAKKMKISRTTLYRKLERFELI